MKLNEISTDKSLDILCELSIPLTTIAQDKELVKAIYRRTKVTEKTSEEDKKVLGTIQVAKNLKIIIPKLLNSYRNEVYEIISIINEKNIEEIKKQNIAITIKQIKDIIQDEELISFFTSILN